MRLADSTVSFFWGTKGIGKLRLPAARSRPPRRRGRSTPLLVLLALIVPLALSSGCGGPDGGAEVAAEITAFEPPAGSLRPGDAAAASARLKNTGSEAHTFFVGYSVRDVEGEWLDAPAVPVDLGPGEESGETQLTTPPLETSGYYASRVSVWSEEPAGEGDTAAERLAQREEESAFQVSEPPEEFAGTSTLPAGWKSTDHRLGRGKVLPENVTMEEGKVRITLPADTVNGGEIVSERLHGPGSMYTARMKVPDAPTSITGFFLYEPPDLESEIDIEIFNEPSGKILFTTYSDGKQTHTKEKKLPFDPTKGFHDYAFFYGEDFLIFYVDGKEMQRYKNGIPNEEMKLYVNSWYPTWLETQKPSSDRYAYIEWIEH